MYNSWRERIFVTALTCMLIPMFYNVRAHQNRMCLTWDVQDHSLILNCRVLKLESDISFLNAKNEEYGYCVSPSEKISRCWSVKGSQIQQDLIANETVLIVDKTRNTQLDGKWSCLYRNNTVRTKVSISDGLSQSADLNTEGEFSETDDLYYITLYCYSCWKPVANAVEVLINNKSKDSLSYHNGKCYHIKGKCNPLECSCSEQTKRYVWKTIITKASFEVKYFSCYMRFLDILDYGSFQKYSTLKFTGKGFVSIKTKASDRTYNKEPTRHTSGTLTRIDKKTEDKVLIKGSVITGVIAVLSFCSVCLFITCHKSEEYRKKTVANIDETLPIIEKKEQLTIFHHEEKKRTATSKLTDTIGQDKSGLSLESTSPAKPGGNGVTTETAASQSSDTMVEGKTDANIDESHPIVKDHDTIGSIISKNEKDEATTFTLTHIDHDEFGLSLKSNASAISVGIDVTTSDTMVQDMTLKENIIINDGKQGVVKLDEQREYPYTEEMHCEIKKGNASPAFFDFLHKLGLLPFFPGKMELMDIMKISNDQKPKMLSDIPLFCLKNIIMINYKARDEMLEDCLEYLTCESQNKVESGVNDNAIDILCDEESEFEINPVDLVVACFKCASTSLVQILASKFFICQLAIPFSMPTASNSATLSTWTLRSVILDEMSTEKSQQYIAIDCPCHVVGFCRLGRPAMSKSKLINEILSDQYHSTCLTKDSPLGTSRRLFSDGLIESTWYQPSEKSQILTNILFILNLRGDASSFISQLDVIRYLSSIAVVLIEIHQLKDIHTKQKLQQFHESVPGLIIGVDASKMNKKSAKKELGDYMQTKNQYIEKTKYIILAANGITRSFSDIKKEMRKSISDLSRGHKQLSVSKRLTNIITKNIISDENITTLLVSKTNAEKIVALIPDDSVNVKNAVVPLQGKPWQEWSETLKTMNKSSRNFTLADISEMQNKMTEQRRKQTILMESNQLKFVRDFVNELAEIRSTDNRDVEYIFYLKSLLDERSRLVLPKYLAKYQADWQALKSARDRKEKESLEKLRNELGKSEMSLAEASFGLEHLLREIGQMYEANVSIGGNEKMKKWCEQLPNICATLLLKGHPFEIMDGDVANVPLQWVTAVLNKLKVLIGDRKMLALSVLGIQSSGKSTLLNTMFGLQFAVSAGRCTRGVFMQLVPVEREVLPFDYVLVIDTEGLRAPELAHQKHTHDNELATYVIGLGDITIVNIKGENTAEVKDVLQIAVHAFLRLKMANERLNLRQSCVFVHQNVPARDATEKMMQGRQKLVETLDEMTKEAANQENLVDIESFNQVIDFDSETNVWYFSDLWQGDPPMAPANPGYSRSVKDVKNDILFRLTKDRTTYLTITDTITRIQDLWNGIIKDGFVFSFRNSLELKAFNSIENKCQASIWEMEKFVFEFVAKEGKTVLFNCKSTEELENAVQRLDLKLKTDVAKELSLKNNELDSFIEHSTLKDVMIQWSQSKHNKLTMLVDNLTLMAKTKLIKLKEEIKIDRMRRDEKTNHEIEINRIAPKIANEEKGKRPDDKKVKEKFETMWNTFINKFDSNLTEEGIPVSLKVESIVLEKFQSLAAFIGGPDPDNIRI